MNGEFGTSDNLQALGSQLGFAGLVLAVVCIVASTLLFRSCRNMLTEGRNTPIRRYTQATFAFVQVIGDAGIMVVMILVFFACKDSDLGPDMAMGLAILTGAFTFLVLSAGSWILVWWSAKNFWAAEEDEPEKSYDGWLPPEVPPWSK
jgi:hypothetical protein